MKKYLKILVLGVMGILFSHSADAQWFVTGEVDMSLSNESVRDSVNTPIRSTHEHSLHLEGGYYFNDRLALGSGVSWGRYNFDEFYNDGVDSKENTYKVYLYLRYDFLRTDKVQLGAKTEFCFSDYGYYSSYNAIIRPVLNYRFTDHWSAYTSFGAVGYSYLEYDNDSIEHSFVANLAPSNISVGVVYTF